MQKSVWQFELIFVTGERVPVHTKNVGLFRLDNIRSNIERVLPEYNGIFTTLRCDSMLMELLPDENRNMQGKGLVGDMLLFDRIQSGRDIRAISAIYRCGGDFDEIAVPWNKEGEGHDSRNFYQHTYILNGHCFICINPGRRVPDELSKIFVDLREKEA